MQIPNLLHNGSHVEEQVEHLRARHSAAPLTRAARLGSRPFEAPLGDVQPLARPLFVLLQNGVDQFVRRPQHEQPDQSLRMGTRWHVALRHLISCLPCLPKLPDDCPPCPCTQFQRLHTR